MPVSPHPRRPLLSRLHMLTGYRPGRPFAEPTTQTERWVREMITFRGGFDASGVTVQVRNGVALLNGVVASPEEALEAARLAASVRGVERVDNQLLTTAPAPPLA